MEALTQDMQWRVARPADFPAIIRLVNEAYRGETGRKGWTTESDLLGGQRVGAEQLRDLLEKPKSAILLVFLSSISDQAPRLVGCVHVQAKENSRAYLGMLTIDVAIQSRGLGSHLMYLAESYVRSSFDARKIEMTVIGQRLDIIRWYEKRGYHLTGEHRTFPYGDERFGKPLRPDLYFEVLEKSLVDGFTAELI